MCVCVFVCVIVTFFVFGSQTLAAAKAHPKATPLAIKFCANEKLLEKFQESNKYVPFLCRP